VGLSAPLRNVASVPRADTQHPLARWRAFHGLSQEALAEDSGVARITIARIERGSDPHVSTALRLAHALGVAVEDVWTWDGEPSAALLAVERRRTKGSRETSAARQGSA